MRKIEVLAPAGNMEALIAAVQAGADAVYLGLTVFSARAFAGNFTQEEFTEAIKYCHIRNVKVYVTMNTMMYEQEIENAKQTVDFLYTHDVDALLIQDLGLFHYVRTCYPDMEVHCSTQMHIHNMNGVRFMQKMGASRVVLARETPIEVIQEACKTGMEIEVFVYGAICISYSGQCLMSASLKNRSANRGMCAQCCRLRYYQEDGSSFQDGKFLLSPKDLNVIENVPALIEAGVSSLKIEGRMKRPEYVWLITRTFREAVDAYYRNEKYVMTTERQQELLLMFNRGFSKGHLFHNDCSQRMSHYRPNHMGVEIGKVLSFAHDEVQVRLSKTLHQHDGLRILNEPFDTGLTAVKILKNGKLVNEAYANDVVTLQCKSKPVPKKGQSLQKTSDAVLIRTIEKHLQEDMKRLPVSVTYEAEVNHNLFVTICDEEGISVTSCSEDILQAAKNAPLTAETMGRLLSKTNDYPYYVTDVQGKLGNVFAPVKMINETRRLAFEQYMALKAVRHVRFGKQPYTFTLQPASLDLPKCIVQDLYDQHTHDVHWTSMSFTPVINETQNESVTLNNCIVSQIGDLNHAMSGCIAGSTLNIANSYAVAYMLSLEGIEGVFFSTECSNEQIHAALQSFENRYGFIPKTYKYVYGHRPVMYIKDTFYEPHISSFIDEQNLKYRVHYIHGITQIEDPLLYEDHNAYCYGSYALISGSESTLIEDENKLYEEFSGRI